MCSVVLDATPQKSISRKHAEIVCRKGRRGPDKYILRDLVRTLAKLFFRDLKIGLLFCVIYVAKGLVSRVWTPTV